MSQSSESKSLHKKLWAGYITIGTVLAAPVFASYFYAMIYVSWHGGLGAAATMPLIMLSSTAMRMLLWPLSFALWLNDYPAATSLWQWLAPGFFVTTGGG